MKLHSNKYAFLSYSHLDRELFLGIVDSLEECGFDLWYDNIMLRAATDFNEDIANAINECGVFVIFLTPSSVNSDYVKTELSYAYEKGKKICAVVLKKCSIPKFMEDMLPKYKIYYLDSELDIFYEKIANELCSNKCDKGSRIFIRAIIIEIIIVAIILICDGISVFQSKMDLKIVDFRSPQGVHYSYYVEDGEITIVSVEGYMTVEIPGKIHGKNVAAIDYKALSNNNMVNITLSEGIKEIGSYAFDKNDMLQKVKLPNSLITIGDYAFIDCCLLREISIPESVTFIGRKAFDGCTITVFAYHEPDYYRYTPDEGVTWVVIE